MVPEISEYINNFFSFINTINVPGSAMLVSAKSASSLETTLLQKNLFLISFYRTPTSRLENIGFTRVL